MQRSGPNIVTKKKLWAQGSSARAPPWVGTAAAHAPPPYRITSPGPPFAGAGKIMKKPYASAKILASPTRNKSSGSSLQHLQAGLRGLHYCECSLAHSKKYWRNSALQTVIVSVCLIAAFRTSPASTKFLSLGERRANSPHLKPFFLEQQQIKLFCN